MNKQRFKKLAGLIKEDFELPDESPFDKVDVKGPIRAEVERGFAEFESLIKASPSQQYVAYYPDWVGGEVDLEKIAEGNKNQVIDQIVIDLADIKQSEIEDNYDDDEHSQFDEFFGTAINDYELKDLIMLDVGYAEEAFYQIMRKEDEDVVLKDVYHIKDFEDGDDWD